MKKPPVSVEIRVSTATSIPPNPTEKTGAAAALAALMASSMVMPLMLFSPSVNSTMALRPEREAKASAAALMPAYSAVLPPRVILSMAALTVALSVVKVCCRITVLPNDQTPMLSLGAELVDKAPGRRLFISEVRRTERGAGVDDDGDEARGSGPAGCAAHDLHWPGNAILSQREVVWTKPAHGPAETIGD